MHAAYGGASTRGFSHFAANAMHCITPLRYATRAESCITCVLKRKIRQIQPIICRGYAHGGPTHLVLPPPRGAHSGEDHGTSERAGLLDGRVALVTGAARGLGRGIAVEYAREGARVVLCDLATQADALGDTKRAVEAAFGAARGVEGSPGAAAAGGDVALVREVDVAVSEQVQGAVEAAVDAFGFVDLVVANAGVNQRGLFTADDGLDRFKGTSDVVMWGSAHACYHGARAMKACGRPGHLLMVGSIMGSVVLGRHSAAYSFCKAGQRHMARVVAGELGEYGIRVNVIEPGWCDTPGERAFATEDELEQFGARIPAGRIGHSADIARAAVFLASGDAAYITGSTLVVDGGFTSAMEVQPNAWAQGDEISLKSS